MEITIDKMFEFDITKIHNFSDFQTAILKVSNKEWRAFSIKAAVLKGSSGTSAIISGAFSIASILMALSGRSGALLSAICFIPASLTTLGAHEIHKIASNMEEFADGDLGKKRIALASSESVAKSLLKETLVTDRFFRSAIAKFLNSPSQFKESCKGHVLDTAPIAL